MRFSRFQGDIAVQITEDGATMKFIDGQPIMDQGLENAVQISLFTKRGWWGNVLFTDENQKIGSDFERERTIIDVQTLNETNEDADLAINWMKNVKLASKYDITVTNPYNNQIYVSIDIFPPGQDVQTFKFLKNNLNWIAQTFNPAHERF